MQSEKAQSERSVGDEAAETPLPRLQLFLGRLLSPLWLPLVGAAVYYGGGWRVENLRQVRLQYRRLRRESKTPLLICANHLTLIDSALVAWALASPWWYILHFDAVPWNLPERANFTRSWWQTVLVYLMKCLPIHRGGARAEVAEVLARFTALLSRGEVGLVFPEGGRSRTGRLDTEAATYGVGRIVRSLPGCRVLCVYLRGEGQQSWSDYPRRGERFRVSMACIEPRSERSGLRGTLEITQQIIGRLAELERKHFGEETA